MPSPKPQKTYLMVVSLSLLFLVFLFLTTGCAHDFPKLKPHLISMRTAQCGEFFEVTREPLTYKFKGWKPIIMCEGYFALSPEDVAAIRQWYDVQRQMGEK